MKSKQSGDFGVIRTSESRQALAVKPKPCQKKPIAADFLPGSLPYGVRRQGGDGPKCFVPHHHPLREGG